MGDGVIGSGRARLVPELLVTDLQASLAFWCGMLGFRILYDRPEEKFAYLDLDGAEVMIEQRSETVRQWVTGAMEQPFGRGINLQIEVADLLAPLERLQFNRWPLFMDVEEKWYRAGDAEIGCRQFLVRDPDGYLVRLCSDIGERPALEQ